MNEQTRRTFKHNTCMLASLKKGFSFILIKKFLAGHPIYICFERRNNMLKI